MAKSLSKQLKNIAKKRRVSTENFVKAAVIQGMNIATLKSPVGNPDLWVWNHPQFGYVDYVAWKGQPKDYTGGNFRANWRLSFNYADRKITNSTDYSQTLPDAVARLANFGLGDVVVFSNPLPYGPRLEFDSWSSQAPDGMVRPAVIAIKSALNKEEL